MIKALAGTAAENDAVTKTARIHERSGKCERRRCRMINGFYAAKSGLRSYQFSLDVTANNIANVDTAGYQAKTANFADLIYTRTQGLDVVAGNGSRVSSTSAVVEQGIYQSGDSLSAIIEGRGYFAVQNPTANATVPTFYMRSGSFKLADDNGTIYLTAPGGGYVLDQGGQRIPVTNGDVTTALTQVALYSFPNPGGLTALGGGLFAPSTASGAAAQDATSRLVQGGLEGSNVDMATEMAHLMTAQRGFQLNAKMLQTIDEIEQTANSLRG
jgi:flagellar basal-body rod protein FlgG